MRPGSCIVGTVLAVAAAGPAAAGETLVAVAANFASPAEEIGAAFTAATGDTILFSFGATGALYAQITQGAPFTAFLGADDKRPRLAVEEGFGVEGTTFTYAVGKSVLYSPSIDVTDGEAVLRTGGFSHIAVAEPGAAPYGAAAMQVLEALGLTDALRPKLVVGENISQTQQFVDSGNAELGFLALSQVVDRPRSQVWQVPAALHAPIRQDAVLLKTGADDAVARTFLDFLRGEDARAVIETHGYGLPD